VYPANAYPSSAIAGKVGFVLFGADAEAALKTGGNGTGCAFTLSATTAKRLKSISVRAREGVFMGTGRRYDGTAR
jgi:hypothetical protein